MGEEEPRKIASGLVPHYSVEEMEGRRVVVFCNLKVGLFVGRIAVWVTVWCLGCWQQDSIVDRRLMQDSGMGCG